MASNFTVIQFQRQHFGNEPGTFNDIEPNVPFVGSTKDFSFDCPNVNPAETAFLMFQSRDVDHQRNVFRVNGTDVFGGLPASPARNSWNGNILLLEPHHQLREAGNVLHVESRNTSGGIVGNIDDFIIDNVVIEYKTRAQQISLIDFAPLSGDDWYIPLNNALAYLTAQGGGRLVVPKRVASYDCTVTAAVEITSDDITIELDAGAVLQNISGSGVDFFRFAGTALTRNRVNFRGGRILSGVAAGHVFTFAPGVGLGFADWTSEIAQRNPAKSILIRTGSSGSGLFTNRFGGPQWEHGSGSTPGGAGCPSVPMVDINTSTNAFNANEFAMLRINAHHNTAPVFSLINDTVPTGAFYSHNRIDVGTIEQVRRGFVKAYGVLGLDLRGAFYDSKTIDRHVIETGTGSGGRDSEQCRIGPIDFVSVIRGGAGVVGVSGTSKSVSSLTRSGSTATATATAHGFAAGQRVYVSCAKETEYNGRFTVTSVPDANTFKYEVSGTPASPATPTITAEGKSVSSLTRSGSTATATATAHGFTVGQRVYVSCAKETEYNGRFTVTSVPDANTFTYAVGGTPETPATGTIVAEVAAMTIAIGASDARHTLSGIGGNRTSRVEVDLNNCGALVLGDHDRCGYYRMSTTLSTVLGEGADARVDTPAVNTDTIAERSSGGGITLLGQNIKAILSFTVDVELPSLDVGATALVAVTATGVRTGDRLIFHPNLNGPGPGAPTTAADLVIGLPWISADDQISFIVHNPSGSSIASSNGIWHGLVFRL